MNNLATLRNTVWAIVPEALDAICEAEATGGPSIDLQVAHKPRSSGTVGVVPVFGMLDNRMSFLMALFGGTSTEQVSASFDLLLKNPDVGSIVLEFDSPGGSIYGIPELATKIHDARGTKPIVAQVNAMCGSAAFWLASACDEIVVTPSGDIGSHGVLAVHYDKSEANEKEGVKPNYIQYGKYKTECSSDAPLTEEAHEELQRRVDQVGEMFTKALAKNRGVSASVVRDRFGQGRMFGASDAIQRGMADREATLEATITRLASGSRAKSRRRAEVGRRRLALAKSI